MFKMTPEDRIVEEYQEISRIKTKWENIHTACIEYDAKQFGITPEKAVANNARLRQSQADDTAYSRLSRAIYFEKQDNYKPRSEYAQRQAEIEQFLTIERAKDSNNIFELVDAVYRYPEASEIADLLVMIEDIWLKMPRPWREMTVYGDYVFDLVRHQEEFFGYPDKGVAPDKSKVLFDIEWSIRNIQRAKDLAKFNKLK